MTITADPDLEALLQDEEDEFEHIVCCCNRNIAMCGEDLTDTVLKDESWSMDDDDNCPKCLPLVEHPCILCGYSLRDRACACGRCWIWDLPDWQQNILRTTRPDLFI